MRRIYLPLLVMALVSLVFGALPLGQRIAYANPGWVTPTGDVANGWIDPTNAWDGNTLTYATFTFNNLQEWGDYIELAHAAIFCDRVQIWSDRSNVKITLIEVDVYYSDGWQNIYSGELVVGSYQEYLIGSTQSVTAMRVRYYQDASKTHSAYLHEADFWEVPPPTVTGTSPIKGTTDDAALVVTINGADFVSGGGLAAEINFGGSGAITGSSVTFVSSTEITATFALSGVTTNLGAAWDVKVTNPDTQSGTGNDLFTIYRPDPTVSAITPSTGEDTGSVNITDLAGTNFVSGSTSVKLAKGGEGDIDGTSVVVESTIKITVTFDLTGVAPGDWDVVVTVAGAESTATLPAGFNVTSAVPSIINSPTIWDVNSLNPVAENTTYSTGLTHFTLTNNSGYAINVTISGEDMTGAGETWTLSNDGSNGLTTYGLMAGLALTSYDIVVRRDAAYNTLISSLAGEGTTQQWGLQFLAPTSFGDGISKSGTVTLTATAA